MEPKLPSDLQKELAKSSKTTALWKDLTPIGRRDFISWILAPKQAETRKRRVESIGSRLASGKKRPCCYALVPMNLYKVLATTPKAKTQWKSLTPDEKRDFVDWVEKAPDSGAHRQRVDKVSVMLASGKRNP